MVAGFLLFLTKFTKLGRNIYALGGNAQAAFYSGISVKLHTMVVFIIAGTCAGIAGIVTTARTDEEARELLRSLGLPVREGA